MKRTLLLLILSSLGMYCLKAQTLEASYENNFSDNVAYVFENLDMSEVTSNLFEYNKQGTGISDSDKKLFVIFDKYRAR